MNFDYSLVVRKGFTKLPREVADKQIKALLQRCNRQLS